MTHRTQLVLVLALARCATAAAAPTWEPDGVPVCTASSNQLSPAAVSDGAGGAIVAWYDYRNGNADIYAQRVLPSGATDPGWPAGGRALCLASGGQSAPAIVSDGSGGAIVVWQDDRGSSSDIYAQRILASGAVDPSWPPNGRALCSVSGDQIFPAVTSDGAGGAIATWRDDRGGPDTDIYVQRVLASGALDPAWPASGRALCTAAGNQSVPAIAPDGLGGALVAWSDLRNAVDSDIYAQRVLASGAVDPAWPADGRALCLAAWNQSGPALVADGAGGAIVTWYDYRSGVEADIYAQRVLATGAIDPTWPPVGRALCTAAGEQYSPVSVADDAGGAVVAWYDYRGGEVADIYAQRMLATGAVDPLWPPDGRALCAADAEQSVPRIVSDGAGGAVVAWMDFRDSVSTDIFAQRVLASGALHAGWPADGIALCTAGGEQYSPSPAADGSGGVIVPWTDFRPGAYADIYAQRADLRGAVAAVEAGPPGSRLAITITPNPASGPVSIGLFLRGSMRVTVDVLDPAGRRVRTLLAGSELPAGAHRLAWDGRDEAGNAARRGVYWVRVRAEGAAIERRLVRVR
ncbi:MAG: FlgD immunoglobulin-like domain containing protein [Candidatus Eiseniibacteriota bacterium]